MGFLDLFRRQPAPQLEQREAPPVIEATGGAVGGFPTAPPFDLRAAMSAMAQFPWVFACVDLTAAQLSRLPIRVYRPDGKGGRVEVSDHPLHRLLARPNPGANSSGLLLRRQVAIDYMLSRTAWLVTDEPRNPRQLQRHHPDTVEPYAEAGGYANVYSVGVVVRRRVNANQVVQIRGPSWTDTEQQLYGTSPVEVLQRLLNTELAVMDSMRRQSKLARPEGYMQPPEGQEWTQNQADRLKSWVRGWQTGEGGMLVLPWDVRFNSVSHSPKDMEYAGALERITSATLAVMHVYPTAVGIQSANYATAQQEAILHWEAREDDAAMLDDGWTRIARMFTGCEQDVVEHDFTGVEALQGKRTSALNRVSTHILNGVPEADAYEEEGFPELAKKFKRQAKPEAVEPDQPDEPARHLRAALQYLSAVGTDGLTREQAEQLAVTLHRASRPRVA